MDDASARELVQKMRDEAVSVTEYLDQQIQAARENLSSAHGVKSTDMIFYWDGVIDSLGIMKFKLDSGYIKKEF